MVSSGSNGRIYNMDSRSFDIETATSFGGKFQGANVNNSSLYRHIVICTLSENKRTYLQRRTWMVLVLDALTVWKWMPGYLIVNRCL